MRSEKAWEWKEVKIPPVKSRQDRLTALHMFIPFIIAGLLFLWGKLLFGAIVTGIGLFLLLLKFAAPNVYELILRLLTALGERLGKGISYAMLTIVYGAVFTPVALFARLIRRDPLNLKWLPSSRTCWLEVSKVDPTRLFDKPFLAETRQAGEYRTSRRIFRISKAFYHTALTLFFLNLACGYLGHKMIEILVPETLEKVSLDNLEWAEDYSREHYEATRAC